MFLFLFFVSVFSCLLESLCPKLCLFVCLFVCLSVRPSVRPSVRLCLFVCLFVSLFLCFFVSFFVCLFVCLFVCVLRFDPFFVFEFGSAGCAQWARLDVMPIYIWNICPCLILHAFQFIQREYRQCFLQLCDHATLFWHQTSTEICLLYCSLDAGHIQIVCTAPKNPTVFKASPKVVTLIPIRFKILPCFFSNDDIDALLAEELHIEIIRKCVWSCLTTFFFILCIFCLSCFSLWRGRTREGARSRRRCRKARPFRPWSIDTHLQFNTFNWNWPSRWGFLVKLSEADLVAQPWGKMMRVERQRLTCDGSKDLGAQAEHVWSIQVVGSAFSRPNRALCHCFVWINLKNQ